MNVRNSLAVALAAAITAVFLSIAIQPAKAATYTWRTGATGTGSAANYTNPTNWVGGVAAVSSTSSTTLRFTSNTTSGSMSTTPGNFFGINQLLIDGTTTYVQGSSLNIGDGGSIVNTSSVLQRLQSLNGNGTGYSVTSTAGTLVLGAGNITRTGTLAAINFSGAGQKRIEQSSINSSIVNNGGPLQLVGSTLPNYIAMSGNGSSVSLNAGSLTVGNLGTPAQLDINSTFTGASGATLNVTPDAGTVNVTASTINYNGLTLNMNMNAFPDTITGYNPDDLVATVFGFASFTGNLGSLTSAASSAPYAGLTWSQVGSVWKSSVYNSNQSLEFRPADGGIYFVPEPSQMVLVAGAAAAFGAMRLRRLRRGRTAAGEALAA